MKLPDPVLAEVMTGTYERSMAVDMGSYERLMNETFFSAIAMPVARSAPHSHTCKSNNGPHLRASAGLARLLQSDKNTKILACLLRVSLPRAPTPRARLHLT